MKSQSKIELSVLGKKISLRASENDPELLKEISELVGTKIKSAEKRVKGGIASQVLLLALVEIAEEYVKAKHRTIQFKRDVSERSEHLLGVIENELHTKSH
jgi:cell division protein ZapA (FtsZ GTPase activity inhibitor)